jgi:hypothetical protein
VSGSITTQVAKMHGSLKPATAGLIDRIAGLVRNLGHAQALATVTQHLGHEGHAVDATIGIERREDFLAAAHFN